MRYPCKFLSIILSLTLALGVFPFLPARAQAVSGDFTYELSEGTATVTGYTGSAAEIAIPSQLDGYPVTAISRRAFVENHTIERVTIPDTVTSIGDSAFQDCTALTAVTIPRSVTALGSAVFYNCVSLTEMRIPDSVVTMGHSVFSGCIRLCDVTLPKYLPLIESNTFSWCESLSEITVPYGVSRISSGAFRYCTSLQKVILPDSLTKIDSYAFSCPRLESITIPSSVTVIEDTAFYYIYEGYTGRIFEPVESKEPDGFIIRGVSGSAAETYAEAMGMQFVSVTEPEYEDHSVCPVSVAITPHLTTVTIPYQLDRRFDAVESKSLRITMPAELLSSGYTIYRGGEVADDCVVDPEGGVCILSADELNATYTIACRSLVAEKSDLHIRIFYPEGDLIRSTPLTDFQFQALSISAPQYTSQATITVSGSALPEQELTLSVDGGGTQTVMTNKAGDYAAYVTLPSPEEGRTYTVRAESGGNAAAAEVTYNGGLPSVSGITLQYNDNDPVPLPIAPAEGSSETAPQPSIPVSVYQLYRQPVYTFSITIPGITPGTPGAPGSGGSGDAPRYETVIGVTPLKGSGAYETSGSGSSEIVTDFPDDMSFYYWDSGYTYETGGPGCILPFDDDYIICSVGVFVREKAPDEPDEKREFSGGLCKGHPKDIGKEFICIYYSVTFRWAIDPSGYVYAGVDSARIKGAETTAYYIPFEYGVDSEAFWDRENIDESRRIKWDAEEYSQQNPLLTDADGCYAWDVPEGWWQVVVEKDGYEPYTTDWMPVLPPQLDVNICLTSTQKPAVKQTTVTDSGVEVSFLDPLKTDCLDGITLTDRAGNAVPFTLEYDREANALGGDAAKSVTLKIADADKPSGSVTLSLSDAENYSGIRGGISAVIPLGASMPGDADEDGSITILDATCIQRHLAGLPTDGYDKAAADCDGDGEVTILDATRIQRYLAGLCGIDGSDPTRE